MRKLVIRIFSFLVISSFSLNLLASEIFYGKDSISTRVISGWGGVPVNLAEIGEKNEQGFLFIHGNGQSYYSWYLQLTSRLKEKYHMVAYDLRGHGNSGKPWQSSQYNQACIWAEDIDSVIEETGLNKPIIVGWSRGGLIAMHYIQCKGTQGLSGVVMVSSRGRLVEIDLPSPESSARFSQVLLEDDDIEKNIQGARIFTDLMFYKRPYEEWINASVMMNVMSPPYARRAMRFPVLDQSGKEISTYSHLTKVIDIPFLVILGGKDSLRSSFQLSSAYRSAMPKAKILVYDDIGHSPFVESPEQFNSDLEDFANKVFDLN